MEIVQGVGNCPGVRCPRPVGFAGPQGIGDKEGWGIQQRGPSWVKCSRTDCPQGIVEGGINAVIVLGKCPFVDTQEELFYGVVVLCGCCCFLLLLFCFVCVCVYQKIIIDVHSDLVFCMF